MSRRDPPRDPPPPPGPPPGARAGSAPVRAAVIAGEVIVRALRAVARRVPPAARKNIEDRIFYAIFQLTRVENDAYGWRPRRPDEPRP